MAEQRLWAPPECYKVQAPQEVPGSLLSEYLDVLRAPGTKNVGANHGSYPAYQRLNAADGRELSATFDRAALETITATDTTRNQYDRFGPTVSQTRWEMNHAKATVDYAGDPPEAKRTETMWAVKTDAGKLDIKSQFNPDTGTIKNQDGWATDANGNVIGAFAYTFNPDGKATSCARSVTIGSKVADYLEWSMQINK